MKRRFNYLQRHIGRGRSESRLSGHTTPALLGLLKHVLRHRTAASALLSVTNATTTTTATLRLRVGLRLGVRLRLRPGPLIRLLGNLQDLLERLIGMGLHRGLHVSEPRVLTRTVAASSATTVVEVAGAGAGAGGVVFGIGFGSVHLKLNESNGLLLYYI
jgi:hypothetical protein